MNKKEKLTGVPIKKAATAVFRCLITACLLVLADASSALAIQEHGDPEGYYVHQVAHLVFIAAMIFLIHVLKKPAMTKSGGWHSIRYAGFFFLIWNINAYLGHMARYRMEPSEAYIKGSIIYLKDFTAKTYYYLSITEYFFLVPGFVFLAIGLNRLQRHIERESGE